MAKKKKDEEVNVTNIKVSKKKTSTIQTATTENIEKEQEPIVIPIVEEPSVINPLITVLEESTVSDGTGIVDLGDAVEEETTTETTLVPDETPLKIIEENVEQVDKKETEVVIQTVVANEHDKEVIPHAVLEKEIKKFNDKNKKQVVSKNKPKNRKINSVFGDFNYMWNGQCVDY